MFKVPKGVMQSPVTPMHADGGIDYDVYPQLVEFYIAQKPSALCMPLHIAEAPSLTLQERQEIAEATVRISAGRVPVLVNVSTSGTDDAISLARHAEEVGADGIFVLPPYYWALDEDGLFNHFVAIASSVEIAFLAYNSPKFQGVEISPALLGRLLDRLDNFVGLKEASHDWEYFIEAWSATTSIRPDFGLLVGIEYLLPSLVLGGSGSLSALGGFAPNLVANLYRACVNEEYDEARSLQSKASRLWTLMKVDYPARIKAAMEIMGRPVGEARGPIRKLGPADKTWLRDQLDKFGVLDEEPCGWQLPSPAAVAPGVEGG